MSAVTTRAQQLSIAYLGAAIYRQTDVGQERYTLGLDKLVDAASTP